MRTSRKFSRRLTFLPLLFIGWWALGYPPGWGWLLFPIIPTMGVSVGVLLTLATVVVGLYAGLIWLREQY
jgi:hypothetical protein